MPEVTSSGTLSSFKSKLKTYLFKLSFPHSDCKVTEVLLHYALKILYHYIAGGRFSERQFSTLNFDHDLKSSWGHLVQILNIHTKLHENKHAPSQYLLQEVMINIRTVMAIDPGGSPQ